jgi:hypothetical protein
MISSNEEGQFNWFEFHIYATLTQRISTFLGSYLLCYVCADGRLSEPFASFHLASLEILEVIIEWVGSV